MLNPDQIMQNKIYRAVHDGVCPNCGHDVVRTRDTMQCCHCGFEIEHEEMAQFRLAVEAWGQGAMAYLQTWRKAQQHMIESD